MFRQSKHRQEHAREVDAATERVVLKAAMGVRRSTIESPRAHSSVSCTGTKAAPAALNARTTDPHRSMSTLSRPKARTILLLLHARIVEPPSRRCGEGTRADIRFATHVVSGLGSRMRGSLVLTCTTGLYYKLHGVHRPVTMKKATIKRRKRVIPASHEDDQDEPAELVEIPSQETTPERGTENDDGSINLGMRRRPDEPRTIDLLPAMRPGGQNSPLPSASASASASNLAAYHQPSGFPRHVTSSLNDDNRLPPMTSMAAAMSERQSSLSPASFLSPRRKRSFSATETEAGSVADSGHESAKRLSSINSILNPSVSHDDRTVSRPGSVDRGEYTLPPLRSSGSGYPSAGSPGPTANMEHAFGGGRSNDAQGLRDVGGGERVKAGRRLALQQERDRMREMLAANERELMELGHE